ncbi:MAG: hypothetical protein NZ551_04465 [Microscillaceae bacterium]|nr:hypothetical protein [Microscillaceae bacterium]MDW8460445.1 hypothetical protein [Cytophagales bacterium]
MIDLKDKPFHEVLFLLLNFLMSMAYIVAGLGLWYYSNKVKVLEPEMQVILSITLILYGFFRMYRVYLRAKTN